MRHRWGVRPARLSIEFFPGAGLERAGSSWPPIVTTPTSPWIGVSLDLGVVGANRAGAPISEAMGWNNGATATIRTVD
ncbi:hypothetical protein GCM10020358_36650 [Amorphoplanes nipponensis]|uniref:Uncharacterized protein n=1 Tax=Actinoplanes nipponensis TaxID=135950 RepID=A0A919MXX4_9ACTN|nr:hypothetical protein [Actinoplanes nipponensis]GIE53840.1 hypothetical protein Ani05nite_73740 [Actinoplanes nipponensis]